MHMIANYDEITDVFIQMEDSVSTLFINMTMYMPS